MWTRPASRNAIAATNPMIRRFLCRSTAASDRRSTSSLLAVMFASRRFQLFPNGLESVGETGFHRPERDIENGGDLAEREVFFVAQDQDRAARRRDRVAGKELPQQLPRR